MATDPRDLNERLKPFQRLLDDLRAAVDATRAAEQSVANHRAQIPPLEAEIKKLSEERAAVLSQVERAYRDRDEAVQKAQAEAAVARTLAKTEQEKFSESLAAWNAKLAKAEQAHRERMGVIRAEQAAAEKALELIQSELAAARRDAEARLSALRG